MRLGFIGADHEVTGSCHYIEVNGHYGLIDYGMEQGEDIFESAPLPVSASDIEFVLLTHAHIDHSGMLPKLYADGFRGRVYATIATCELCDIMLRDSAHIQMFEAEWKNRKAKRSGGKEYVPVYDVEDVVSLMKYFTPCEYNEIIEISDDIQIRFIDVGHLLGSASIEVWMTENGKTRKVVFSGDIGNTNQPIIRDPRYVHEADFVVMESTYGDRNHPERKNDYVERLTDILNSTFAQGGNVVIPAFAVGRTQEMLYFLRQIKSERRVKDFEDFEVYIDSPLAIEATEVFKRNAEEYYDEATLALVRKNINPIAFKGLKVAVSSEESKAINFDEKPKVIISASGMCEAGRIRHHLKHNLWRSNSTILFSGYQANGTLGRALLEGVEDVKLFGEAIEVKARIQKFEGVSGHADQAGLIKWINEFTKRPKEVFVVHGEDSVCNSFAELLREQYGYKTSAPYSGSVFDLIKEEWETVAEPIAVLQAEKKQRRASAVFEKLLAAGQRLLTVIKHNEGGTNKDLGKFMDQINALCDKWDR
ncbi:MAG: MBL fold metallo-hydrolase [Lachnospiraceae bacterium]|nr:MBL fold metallo-hydrolase [Lachnospiraceae bacterium]